jgi:hypothetical protein
VDDSKHEGHSEALLKAIDETRNTNRGPFFWPRIYDSETAKAAVRLGVVGASMIVALSLAGTILQPSSFFLAQAVVFVAIGFGIHRTSRIAAWMGLCLFPFAKVPFHLGIATVFFLITPFINGVRGAMAYHRYPKGSSISDPLSSTGELSEKASSQKILVYSVLIVLFALTVFYMKRQQIHSQRDNRPHSEEARQQMDATFEKQINDWIIAGVNLNSIQHFHKEQGFPLIFAGASCLDRSFDLLIARGVSVHATVPENGWNALDLLAIVPVCPEGSLSKMMGTLTQRGLDVNAPIGTTSPLQFAVNQGLISNARVLLQLKADVNRPVQDKTGLTPLMLACISGWSEMAKLLVDHGADVNAKSADGITALQICETLKKQNGEHSRPDRDFDAIINLLKQHGAK